MAACIMLMQRPGVFPPFPKKKFKSSLIQDNAKSACWVTVDAAKQPAYYFTYICEQGASSLLFTTLQDLQGWLYQLQEVLEGISHGEAPKGRHHCGDHYQAQRT